MLRAVAIAGVLLTGCASSDLPWDSNLAEFEMPPGSFPNAVVLGPPLVSHRLASACGERLTGSLRGSDGEMRTIIMTAPPCPQIEDYRNGAFELGILDEFGHEHARLVVEWRSRIVATYFDVEDEDGNRTTGVGHVRPYQQLLHFNVAGDTTDMQLPMFGAGDINAERLALVSAETDLNQPAAGIAPLDTGELGFIDLSGERLVLETGPETSRVRLEIDRLPLPSNAD